MHPDHIPYAKFMTRANLDKSLNSLSGILEGILLDGIVNSAEAEHLKTWVHGHMDLQDLHPFNEFIPIIENAIGAGEFAASEREDLRWLFERLRSSEYYDYITTDLQRLHAIIGAIIADGTITEDELRALAVWLRSHEHLASCYPYDEIDSLISMIMADGKIDAEEHKLLIGFFSNFVAVTEEQTIKNSLTLEFETLGGLCAVCPNIEFEGSTFCFTGASSRFKRHQFREIVERNGGRFIDSVSPSVKYLVIGAAGNPCWSYACYGRKVEQAVNLRKAGAHILLVHENDFHDAVADNEH